MLRIAFYCFLLALAACAPVGSPLQLPENCRAEFSASQLLEGQWRTQPGSWLLRQSVLVQAGGKKLPLEGLLQLDPQRQESRLLAMNEMGLVLFDLQVTATGEQLHRVVPQLQDVSGLAQGVAQSLRQIYFSPQPEADDQLENHGNYQRLWRPLAGGSLGFVFDCLGDLRETRSLADNDDWQVVYDQYQTFGTSRLPEEILMNDFRHGVSLSLWLREVKQKP